MNARGRIIVIVNVVVVVVAMTYAGRQTNIININSVINNTTVHTRTIDIFNTRLRVGGQTLSNIPSDFAIALRDY